MYSTATAAQNQEWWICTNMYHKKIKGEDFMLQREKERLLGVQVGPQSK
jgi:hypothetical protein